MYRINYARNGQFGFERGEDKACCIEEAHDIAVTRLKFGGIPGHASVYLGDVEVRRFGKDFDGRISYHEPKKEATDA